MKCIRWIPTLFLITSCAPLGVGPGESLQRSQLWDEAHGYFSTSDFERADSVFALIGATYPETNEGRESLFYRGALALDPRNPKFNSEPAEAYLQQYLLVDSGGEASIHRRPEGETLYEIARQLNFSSPDRIPALQNPTERTTIVRTERPPQTNAEENVRLRRELAARDETIVQLREELERIRRTLTGGQGGQ